MREQEARRAAHMVGVSRCYFLNNHDGKLKKNQKTISEAISLIRQIKRHIIYIPHKNDAHKDHRTTHTIIKKALLKEYLTAPWDLEKIFCYEVWTPLQTLTYSKNITDHMELKLNALRQHITQIDDRRYDDAIEGLNRYRGVMTGKGKYCECFEELEIQ